MVTYTPNVDYLGPDSFTFTANDGALTSAPATVSITVVAADLAVAQGQAATTDEDAAKEITLVATGGVAPVVFAVSAPPAHGTIGAVVGDKVTYTPDANYFGADSFEFSAKGVGAAATPANLTLTVTAVNDPAVAAAALSNENDPMNARYSVLSYLEGFRQNGGFELRIDWPLVPGVSNIWQQQSNPMVAGAVTGYRGVRIDAASQYWGGLELSNNVAALLDGSVTSPNFWFAVGSTAAFQGGIPAATEIGGTGITTQAELWVRPMPKCGNGVKESLETCDDGNEVDGDGCSASCAVERTAQKTCREILAANESVGDGSYVVDVDGAGGIAPFAVYCEMSLDGGGWTLLGKVGQGNFTALSDVEYLALVANPGVDVNPGALTEGSLPASSAMAFLGKEHTNALYAASGKTVRVDMALNYATPGANGTYFQQKIAPPAGWDLWSAIRDARRWNDNGAVAGESVSNFGTQFVLGKGAAAYDAATNTVTHQGDGSFGWWSAFTHVLADGSSLSMSRHGGLLCDGHANQGWQWLLTLNRNDARWKNDTATWTKSRIWLR